MIESTLQISRGKGGAALSGPPRAGFGRSMPAIGKARERSSPTTAGATLGAEKSWLMHDVN
jgi:hypothetical protein